MGSIRLGWLAPVLLVLPACTAPRTEDARATHASASPDGTHSSGPTSSADSAPSAGSTPSPESTSIDGWLERIYTAQEFKPSAFSARWIDGGSAYAMVESAAGPEASEELVRYDAESGKRTVLVGPAQLTPAGASAPLALEDHAWSADGKRLLVFTNTKRVWRQNTRGDYWVLDVDSGKLRQLGGDAPEASLMFAKLSPDATRAAYVRANDLWVEDLASGAVARLTSDGSDTIVNGTSDWVYEEELDVRDGWRWSPDGTRIAFWRFDQSGLGIYPLVNTTDTLYPVVREIPYPKAGTTNSAVTVGIVPAAGGEPVWAALPGDAREFYVARVDWVDATGELLIQRLDRRQKEIELFLVDPASGAARSVLKDRDEAWIDVVDDRRWLEGGKALLWTSERDGWRHLWSVPMDGGEWRLVTPGEYDVTGLAGVDEARGLVYFLASPAEPARRYLYRVSLFGGRVDRVTPAEPGTHTYELAPSGVLAFHTVSAFDEPPRTSLVRLPSHERVRVLEDNAALAERMKAFAGEPVEFLRVAVEPGVELEAWIIRPAGFDPSRRYPVVQFVYGEPGAVQVTDAWKTNRLLFNRALAQAGYAVVCVDSRGSPTPRGREWRKCTAGMPGKGADDQAAGLRALLAARPFLDPERVAVWGWSGGGTMTLNLMFRYADLYRVGMAVAPVPDLTLYDSIYQERYTGLPEENPEGYRQGSPITFAEGLRGDLLLVHGTGDDNVHMQGTERLINRLVELGKPFQFMEYPNRTHAISEGKGTQLHVFSLLAHYLQEHLPAAPSS